MSDDTAALKSRRTAAKTTATTAGLPPNANVPPEIGKDEPARRYPTLGDPREPALVLGQSGMTNGGDRGGQYVRAAVDGVEYLYPAGCKQPSTRQRWKAGQWVLREVYEKYVADHAETLIPPTPDSVG